MTEAARVLTFDQAARPAAASDTEAVDRARARMSAGHVVRPTHAPASLMSASESARRAEAAMRGVAAHATTADTATAQHRARACAEANALVTQLTNQRTWAGSVTEQRAADRALVHAVQAASLASSAAAEAAEVALISHVDHSRRSGQHAAPQESFDELTSGIDMSAMAVGHGAIEHAQGNQPDDEKNNDSDTDDGRGFVGGDQSGTGQEQRGDSQDSQRDQAGQGDQRERAGRDEQDGQDGRGSRDGRDDQAGQNGQDGRDDRDDQADQNDQDGQAGQGGRQAAGAPGDGTDDPDGSSSSSSDDDAAAARLVAQRKAARAARRAPRVAAARRPDAVDHTAALAQHAATTQAVLMALLASQQQQAAFTEQMAKAARNANRTVVKPTTLTPSPSGAVFRAWQQDMKKLFRQREVEGSFGDQLKLAQDHWDDTFTMWYDNTVITLAQSYLPAITTWELLVSHIELSHVTVTDDMSATQEYHMLAQRSGETIAAYITRFQMLRQRLPGHVANNDAFVSRVVFGIHGAYAATKHLTEKNLRAHRAEPSNTDQSAFAFSELINRLQINQREAAETALANSAMFTPPPQQQVVVQQQKQHSQGTQQRAPGKPKITGRVAVVAELQDQLNTFAETITAQIAALAGAPSNKRGAGADSPAANQDRLESRLLKDGRVSYSTVMLQMLAKAGVCYRCGEKGHRASDRTTGVKCTKPVKDMRTFKASDF